MLLKQTAIQTVENILLGAKNLNWKKKVLKKWQTIATLKDQLL